MALVVDTGPLLALTDQADPAHDACLRLVNSAGTSLVVPSPVLVEVAYWIEQRLHPRALLAFLDGVTRGGLHVEDLRDSDYERVRELCEQYADARVGFVDAAVLAVVERLGEPKLATLDRRHFTLMRPRHVDALELLPA